MGVGIVVVSHSVALAQAAVELAALMLQQNLPNIQIAAGTDEGGFGTDATAVLSAIQAADSGAGVAVFTDLGSALTSTDLALELLAELKQEIQVEVLAAPFVEGLVAAAVQATSGADLVTVAATANGALRPKQELLSEKPLKKTVSHVNHTIADYAETSWDLHQEVLVTNPAGLHARPAAQLAQLAASFEAEIELVHNGQAIDAASMLEITTLGATQGDTITIRARGTAATQAVSALKALLKSGFNEA